MIRTSAGTSVVRRRSDWSPAHTITLRVTMSPAVVATTRSCPVSRIPVTSTPSWISPPIARMSSAIRSLTATKSMIAVRGDHSAPTPAACGSISRMRSGPTSSRPSTSLASPRSSSVRIRGSSSSPSATTSLPTCSTGMSCRTAYASIAVLPARHRRALNDPGA